MKADNHIKFRPKLYLCPKQMERLIKKLLISRKAFGEAKWFHDSMRWVNKNRKMAWEGNWPDSWSTFLH